MKYIKTKIIVEVLSEGSYFPDSLESIVYDLAQGSCVGDWTVERAEELTPEQMEKALVEFGSEPAFFQSLVKEE